MKLNIKENQLELIEGIYENLHRTDIGNAIEAFADDICNNADSEYSSFYEKLRADYGTEIALELDEIVGDKSSANHHSGFITGFICAMTLTGNA
jgi:hypothetical protein